MDHIVHPIIEEGGRFMSENGNVMDDNEVFEKVSQALRDLRKQKESKAKASRKTKRLKLSTLNIESMYFFLETKCKLIICFAIFVY
jgi:hypothetical protein